ncbi:hypothetical protein QCA50_011153 [Cerrena zonata]|uniref:Carbohydrate-binding module family 13 protein n=1 Tax=Cerrena zonata TaxID=2478898 RepID=A0AAW0G0B0_9APHY
MSFAGRGIYHIVHAHVPNVRMALGNKGSCADNTPIIVYDTNNNCYDHMWLVEPITDEADIYTIRNLSTGSYMDLSQSSSRNGASLVGFHKNSQDNQKWNIGQEESNSGWWKIQSKATGTFLDLLYGGGSGTPVQGWHGSWSDSRASPGHQHWVFKRLSETSVGVRTILQSNPIIRMDFGSLRADRVYLIPTREELKSIWQASGLGKTKERSVDIDELCTMFRAEVFKWRCSTFKADGFTLLCGTMFGTKNNATYACNWTLRRDDFARMIFFKPQNGAISEDAWAYAAYFGLL